MDFNTLETMNIITKRFQKIFFTVILFLQINLLFSQIYDIDFNTRVNIIDTSKNKIVHCYEYFQDLSKFKNGKDTCFCKDDKKDETIKVILCYISDSIYVIESFYEDGSVRSKIHQNFMDRIEVNWQKNGNIEDMRILISGFSFSCDWRNNEVLETYAIGKNIEDKRLTVIQFDSLERIISKDYKDNPNEIGIVSEIYFPSILKGIYKQNAGKQPYNVFFENGSKKIEGFIYQVDFAQVGKWIEWYPNGIKYREYCYNDSIPNLREGTWFWWNEKGKLTKKEVYKNGELIEQKFYQKPKNEEVSGKQGD